MQVSANLATNSNPAPVPVETQSDLVYYIMELCRLIRLAEEEGKDPSKYAKELIRTLKNCKGDYPFPGAQKELKRLEADYANGDYKDLLSAADIVWYRGQNWLQDHHESFPPQF